MGPALFVTLSIVALALLIAYRAGYFDRPVSSKNFQLLPETFVVADIETTGLDADKHEIIEIAAIRVHRDSDRHDTFSGLAKPEKKVSKKITSITGITQAELDKDGDPIDELMREFLDFVGDDLLVFYNAPFDMGFLSKAADRIGRPIANPVVDALPMARRAFPGRKSYKLADLAKESSIDFGRSHRALVDCQVTMTVYAASVQELGTIR